MQANQQIIDTIKQTVEAQGEEGQKSVTALLNKFYFHSGGKAVTEKYLYEKFFSGKRKPRTQTQLKDAKNWLHSSILLLLATNKAIAVEDESGQTLYKFTEKPEIFLRVLQEEEAKLLDRLKWVHDQIAFFQKTES